MAPWTIVRSLLVFVLAAVALGDNLTSDNGTVESPLRGRNRLRDGSESPQSTSPTASAGTRYPSPTGGTLGEAESLLGRDALCSSDVLGADFHPGVPC